MIQRFNDSHKDNLITLLILESNNGRELVRAAELRQLIDVHRESLGKGQTARQNHYPTLKALSKDGFIRLVRHSSTLEFYAELTDKGLKKAFEFFREREK